MSNQKQGANDAIKGKGPANNPNWTARQRENYNAAYSRHKK
jgi:hypothetical protein